MTFTELSLKAVFVRLSNETRKRIADDEQIFFSVILNGQKKLYYVSFDETIEAKKDKEVLLIDCFEGNIFYIHVSIFDDFMKAFKDCENQPTTKAEHLLKLTL